MNGIEAMNFSNKHIHVHMQLVLQKSTCVFLRSGFCKISIQVEDWDKHPITFLFVVFIFHCSHMAWKILLVSVNPIWHMFFKTGLLASSAKRLSHVSLLLYNYSWSIYRPDLLDILTSGVKEISNIILQESWQIRVMSMPLELFFWSSCWEEGL